jgi:ribulose-phosphate 3-epimerase
MSKDLQAFSYPTVSPSLLAAPKDKIVESIALAKESGAPFIHIDCMDGKFVPHFAYDEAFVKRYHDATLVNDVHIMIEKPWLFVNAYAEAGADILTFHLEACPEKESVLSTIKEIRALGLHPGLSIKPATPFAAVLPYLPFIDLLLIMSVEPGRGGQPFLPNALGKIRLASFEKKKAKVEHPFLIEVDGGINELTGPQCVEEGADVLVAGSYLYGHEDFALRLKKLIV